jgi:hypothetical protein
VQQQDRRPLARCRANEYVSHGRRQHRAAVSPLGNP